MRIWLLVPLCVLCVAGAVLYSSETQRSTSAITYKEAATAQALLSTFLNRDRAFDLYLETHDRSALEDYLADGRRLQSLFRRAEDVSSDDAAEQGLQAPPVRQVVLERAAVEIGRAHV